MEIRDENRFVNAATYRPTTGEVVAIYSAYLDSVEVMSKDSGLPFVIANEELAANTDLYFVQDEKILLRPLMPIDRVGTRFAGVPPGSQVFVDGALMGTCGDGIVELEISAPGRYVVRLELFPFLSYEEAIDES